MTADSSESARLLAIRERARNVVVEASAGTGKTTFVVERLLALVAPDDDNAPIPIERVAAITFTRKAAGELRIRTRQRILHLLATLPAEAPRRTALRAALAGVDTAEIGTIHSFADRLLRRWPARASLDPRYALDDDPDRLIDECFELLVHAAESATLADLLRGTVLAARADEARETIVAYQRAGLRSRSRSGVHRTQHGLDHLVAGFVRQRDVALEEPPLEAFDRPSFERFADELVELADGLSRSTKGGRWLVETAALVRRVRDVEDPAVIYDELVRRLELGPRGRASLAPTRRDDFTEDPRAWEVWKAFDGDSRKRPVRDRPLREDLLAPLQGWLARRLARLQPVVLQLYEQVKARHAAVDHVDLLLRLRDLLRDDLDVRREAQRLFDHIFVDEFQDTDPLQAEVLLYLCDRSSNAAVGTEMAPGAGTLTLVGDPKQSIYRFRRADLAAYRRVTQLVARAGCVSVRLSESWRSTPALVGWINDRFDHFLGADVGAPSMDAVTYARLVPGRATGGPIAVHVVTLEPGMRRAADELRALEADASARYVRWLVEVSGLIIEDPIDGRGRAVGYGDIAVLALATTNLRELFDAFDRDGVPYAARGGSLFLTDPLHRAFMLGLAALADRDDGVALAALLRPPFFAVDLGDLARARPDDPDDRVAQAKAIVAELRRGRFERSVGATARALLEDTAIGRVVARGPNGSQRLQGLRELCLELEVRALDHQIDFDAAVEGIRPWITRPHQRDRPQPVGDATVRVLTVHQAKGLEFPVVVLWDACATWAERGGAGEPWLVERDGRSWAIDVEQLEWEHPEGRELAKRERRMREDERKRLVYVAATRARDLLVVPRIVGRDDDTIFGRLIGAAPHPAVLVHPVHAPEVPAEWYTAVCASTTSVDVTTALDSTQRAAWEVSSLAASRGSLRPLAFTDAKSPRTFWGRRGRFGLAFGSVVHQAIGFALARVPAADAVARAARALGLTHHLDEAVEDVRRALATLDVLGVSCDRATYQLEYPVAGSSESSDLLAGYIDLVARTPGGPIVLDFKTDAHDAPVPLTYSTQVRGYARVVARGLGEPSLRAGLLFTSDGRVDWL